VLATWLGLAPCCWACTAIPPAPLDSAERAGALRARSLEDPELHRFAAESVGLALPSGDEPWPVAALATSGLYFQPRVAIAAAELRRASAAIESARALPNPTLSIAPEYSLNPARGESPWSPALQLDWPIATAGKRGHAIDRATADALAAHYALASELVAVERDVHLARLELAAAERAAQILAQEAEVARALVVAWRQRVELGAASHAESAPAELAAFTVESELAAARAREAGARAALAAAIAIPSASLASVRLVPVEDSADSPGSPERTTLALTQRADVLGALARYAAVEATLQGEVAKQFPDLRIGSGYQWDQGQSKFLVGLSLDLPIFDRNYGPIAEAVAARARAAAEFDAVQTAALAEIERSGAQAAAARERADVLRASAAALSAQAARAEASHAAGAGTRLDALSARALALRAARELSDATSSAAAANAALTAALAPARDDIAAIAQFLADREEP
jgi:outer membrane protein TolC